MIAPLIQLTRQVLVVSILKQAGVPLESEVLLEKLSRSCDTRGIEYPYANESRMRMLQRDIKAIYENMGIVIRNIRNKGYEIVAQEERDENYYQKLFEDFDLLTSVQPEMQLSPYIFPEHHRGPGSRYLFNILYAIKNKIAIDFEYDLVRHNKKKRYRVHPYFLKESQQKWYLIADDNGKYKMFGLDRIVNLVETDFTFTRKDDLNPQEMFADCYGIWNDPSQPIEEIELRYDSLDGKFLKGLPLHTSQEIIIDTEDEFRIRLRLRITNDFVMALLSRSRSVEVIRPLHLRQRIAEISLNCAKRNI